MRLGYKRRHTHPVLTLFGQVRITRIGYGAPDHQAIHPLDRQLRLPGRIYSYECQRRLIRAVVCTPFDEAIAFIAEITGVAAPKRSAEQLVREAAVDFDEFYSQRQAACVKPARGEILVAAIDCKGIPMVKPERALRVVRRGKGEKANKKRMATVAAVHNQAPVIRTPQEVLDSLFQTGRRPERQPRPRPSHKRVWASLTASKDTFIADVKAEMRRRDPRRRRTWVIVTDGERALQHRVADSFEDVTLILDLLHALEKLWKAAHALYHEGSPEAQAFVYQRTKRILEGHVDQVVKGLKLIVTKRRLTANKIRPRRSWTSPPTSSATANGCATTPTWPTAGPSHQDRSKAPARTSSATASSAPACAGPNKPPKPCYASAPSTSRATSTATGNSTSSAISNAYTRPGRSS
jgi:hypothetical protein